MLSDQPSSSWPMDGSTKLESLDEEDPRLPPHKKTEESDGDLTEDQAASIIQNAYRKRVKRKDSLQSGFKPLQQDEIEFIKPFARRWKSKTIYQVLTQLRSHYYQECFNLSIQVHLYNAQFYFEMLELEKSVNLNTVDESATASSWLGRRKAPVLKMPFHLDDIPYYDTTVLTCDPLTNVGVACERIEPWDAPIRYREMLAARKISVESETNSNTSSMKRQHSEELAYLPFNRNPEKPIVALPPVEDPEVKDYDTIEDENYEVIGRKIEKLEENKNFCLTKQAKNIENQAMQTRRAVFEEKKEPRPTKENQIINSSTKPANKDFDYIKPAVVPRPRVDPVVELQSIARRNSSTNDDDPPFNFQGMLRKTNYKRDSLRRTVREPKPYNFRSELKSVDRGTEISTMKDKPKVVAEEGVKIETELMPGFYISGVEFAL